MSPDAEQFLRSAMPTLGWAQRTCGHWSHGLQVTNSRHDEEKQTQDKLFIIYTIDGIVWCGGMVWYGMVPCPLLVGLRGLVDIGVMDCR